MSKLPVIDFYGPVVQGEGALVGMPTYFLRLGGCDYKCSWCDSMHAVDPEQVKANAKYLDLQELQKLIHLELLKTKVRTLTLSGGNPCIHDLSELVERLKHGLSLRLAVETQGTIFKPWVADCDWVTVSPKGPSSGMVHQTTPLDYFLEALKPASPIMKIVIDTEADLEFARFLYTRYAKLSIPFWYLQTCTPQDVPNEELTHCLQKRYRCLIEVAMKDKVLCNFRILPQLHALIYGHGRTL